MSGKVCDCCGLSVGELVHWRNYKSGTGRDRFGHEDWGECIFHLKAENARLKAAIVIMDDAIDTPIRHAEPCPQRVWDALRQLREAMGEEQPK